jgi:RNA polymerase sigma-70 factor (ECF subfamily)
MEKLSDNELALMARSDIRYFTPLFDRFFKPVYRYFYARIRLAEDAEDLTSETFMKIAQGLNSFTERGIPFSVWVFRIAHNILIDHYRRSKDRTTDSLEDLDPSREPSSDFDLASIDRNLASEKLWAALRVLPQRQQEIWTLKLSKGMLHKDIAQVLGLSENQVNVDICRSLKTLKKYLAPYAK